MKAKAAFSEDTIKRMNLKIKDIKEATFVDREYQEKLKQLLS